MMLTPNHHQFNYTEMLYKINQKFFLLFSQTGVGHPQVLEMKKEREREEERKVEREKGRKQPEITKTTGSQSRYSIWMHPHPTIHKFPSQKHLSLKSGLLSKVIRHLRK